MTGVRRSAAMARETACRSVASSPRVELTNTRSRWSGVRMTTPPATPGSPIAPGKPTAQVWNQPAPPATPCCRDRCGAAVPAWLPAPAHHLPRPHRLAGAADGRIGALRPTVHQPSARRLRLNRGGPREHSPSTRRGAEEEKPPLRRPHHRGELSLLYSANVSANVPPLTKPVLPYGSTPASTRSPASPITSVARSRAGRPSGKRPDSRRG